MPCRHWNAVEMGRIEAGCVLSQKIVTPSFAPDLCTALLRQVGHDPLTRLCIATPQIRLHECLHWGSLKVVEKAEEGEGGDAEAPA